MDIYAWIIILTELLMIAMTLHVVHYSEFTKEQKTWYLLTFASVMICAAAEYAVHCGYYDPKFKIPLTIITVIQFSIAPLLGVFFSGALGLHKQARTASTLFALNFIVEAVAAPFGWIFVFNDAGYSRGDLFIIYEAFYLISLVYLIVSMVIVGKRFRNRDFLTIGMVLVILIAGIIPMTVSKINITYVAIAMSASLCYIYYNDLVQLDTQTEFRLQQEKIANMQSHMISGLANLIETRDSETGGHVYRTSAYIKLLAECAKKDGIYPNQVDERFITLLVTLAPMHDIGKITVPDYILKKPGRLSEEEYIQMKHHTDAGGGVVRDVLNGVTDEDYIKFASDIATFHHERWDGTGYPMRLKGEDIPLSARFMALADVYDALISKRYYKGSLTPEESLDIIEQESGTHFDPNLVNVMLNHRDEFIKAGYQKDIQ